MIECLRCALSLPPNIAISHPEPLGISPALTTAMSNHSFATIDLASLAAVTGGGHPRQPGETFRISAVPLDHSLRPSEVLECTVKEKGKYECVGSVPLSDH